MLNVKCWKTARKGVKTYIHFDFLVHFRTLAHFKHFSIVPLKIGKKTFYFKCLSSILWKRNIMFRLLFQLRLVRTKDLFGFFFLSEQMDTIFDGFIDLIKEIKNIILDLGIRQRTWLLILCF